MTQLNDIFRIRNTCMQAVRGFFAQSGGVEIETPLVVTCPGTETHLRYFPTSWTDYSGQTHSLYLRSSPELHMKQAMAAGLDCVFQIAKCFRNHGECSKWHHPEFTMLEWYREGYSLDALIDESVALIRHIAKAFAKAGLNTSKIENLPVTKLSVADAFKQFVGIDLVDQDADLASKAKAKGVRSVKESDDFDTAFFKCLMECVEPKLAAAGFVVLKDYPASHAALANVRNGWAQRFEIYLNGIEICNAFDELVDVEEDRRRYELMQDYRRREKMEVPPADEFYRSALQNGLKPCAGNALGLDRLMAVILGHDDLSGVVPYREQIYLR